mmetsp:Transcript_34926/g.51077  ORF Transcript_34926/g.51077 Transcript_34926/m.51077 type:complete len:104 (+) Transcript_34926:244-555(+)
MTTPISLSLLMLLIPIQLLSAPSSNPSSTIHPHFGLPPFAFQKEDEINKTTPKFIETSYLDLSFLPIYILQTKQALCHSNPSLLLNITYFFLPLKRRGNVLRY